MKTHKLLLFLGLSGLLGTNINALPVNLHTSCFFGNLGNLQKLIIEGYDVNEFFSIRGTTATPVYFLSSFHNEDKVSWETRIMMLRALIRAGANLNITTHEGYNVFTNTVNLLTGGHYYSRDPRGRAGFCLELLRVHHLLSTESLEHAQNDLESVINLEEIGDAVAENGSLLNLYQRITRIINNRKHSEQDPQERVVFERENYEATPLVLGNTQLSIPMAKILLQN